MKKRVWIIALLVGVLLLSGCNAGDYEAVKTQVRNLYGENEIITGEYDSSLAAVCNNGVFVGLNDNGVISYKGIPYAEPPVGNLRWKNPVPARDSETVYQAYYYGYSPVQTEWPSEPGSYYPQSEDCLTLNVWSNANGPSDGKTVMVFFHGGSYGWGAVSDPMYDGHNLIEKYPDVILVTVEYRLGILGFIDFSSVPGGDEYSTSGNLGLLDQVCALQWIKKNISAFGGNPDNVTIFGESAGAGSVSLIPLINEADGLYRRIIAESGSVALTYSKEECRNLTNLLLEKSGCSTMSELTALSEEELMSLNEGLNDYNNFPERDGVVLPEDLYGAYENGEAAKSGMLIGTNADEVRYWINEMGYYVSFIPGTLIYRHIFPIMYENNCKRMTDEEKQRAEKFLSMQIDLKIWKLTEFYNELLFRVPAMKQAELYAKSGNTVYAYYWKMP
ncbi:MAG: carboxylesterase family protein, partial [Clostridia bacterium]|nr:carboxylesterase family protein [Clostridia bacterium]